MAQITKAHLSLRNGRSISDTPFSDVAQTLNRNLMLQ
jgi:hypothetical protein